VTQIKVEVARS